MALAAVCALALPIGASGATFGVSGDLNSATVSATSTQPSPYSTFASGSLFDDTSYYAPISGSLTQASVKHYNASPVVVKILVFRLGSGNNMTVVASGGNMTLPTASSPGVVTTAPIGGSVPVSVGDRIGLAYVSGAVALNDRADNASTPVPGHGTFATPTPGSEPMVNDSLGFSMVGSDDGPLIQGTVLAVSPSPPAVPASPPTRPPVELSGGTTVKAAKDNKVVNTVITCSLAQAVAVSGGVCTGTVVINPKPTPGLTSARVAKRIAVPTTYGSKEFKIPAGQTQRVRVPLRRSAREKLAQKGKLRGYAVLTETGSGTALQSQTPITIKGKRRFRRR